MGEEKTRSFVFQGWIYMIHKQSTQFCTDDHGRQQICSQQSSIFVSRLITRLPAISPVKLMGIIGGICIRFQLREYRRQIVMTDYPFGFCSSAHVSYPSVNM